MADALLRREAPEAPLADLELAHDRMLVVSIRGLSQQVADEARAGGPAHLQIDPDTAVNEYTWAAALRSAGATLAATDAGAYQLLQSTWDSLAWHYGLRNFTPKNQDLGAVALIAGRGALEDVQAGRNYLIVKKWLSSSWLNIQLSVLLRTESPRHFKK